MRGKNCSGKRREVAIQRLVMVMQRQLCLPVLDVIGHEEATCALFE